MNIPIAKVTHYYDKIGVAVVEVTGQPLNVGDQVKISGKQEEFSQTVGSLQMEHNEVKSVSPGETAGLKVKKPVKAGDMIFLLENK